MTLSVLRDSHPVDTAALLRACVAGDQDAWEVLVRRYQRLVYAIPRRAGLGDDGSAEVFQRVWLKLFEHLGQIEQPERLASWLVTTARRESWHQLRAEQSRLRRDGAVEETVDWLADPAPLPDELVERLERQQVVRSCVACLDPRCQALIKALFYQESAPAYAELAAELGVAEGSIGPGRARCLRRLQRLLDGHELHDISR